jgi:hypothetical protein
MGKASWSKAAAEYFAQIVAEHGPKDYKKLRSLMKSKDAAWTFDEQQLRSRVLSMKRQASQERSGKKRAPEKLEKKEPAKKARRDPLIGTLRLLFSQITLHRRRRFQFAR